MATRRILTTLAVLALGVGLTARTASAACCPTCCENVVPSVTLGGTHTYQDVSVAGPKLCTTNAAANRFGSCSTDADCGGTGGSCLALPWLTVDGLPVSFPTGVKTTFTLTENTDTSSCRHTACIACGSVSSPCPKTSGLPANCTGVGTPATCCTGVGTGSCGCCNAPGFTVPAFYIAALGYCSRTDQTKCGDGVVNSRNPQQVPNGDLDVTKKGDSSDPGGPATDCTYPGTAKPCNSAAGGAGADTRGRISSAYGNGAADAAGIQSRFRIPIRSFTWNVGVGMPGACPTSATWSGPGSGPAVTGFDLVLEPTTANATGQFVDMNGDGCSLPTGSSGFTGVGGASTAGPISVTGIPAPYGGGAFRTVAAQPIFPGSGPLFDLGFVTITPYSARTNVTTQSCSCTLAGGCPETLTSP